MKTRSLIAVMFGLSASFAFGDLDDGLVSKWAFDENSGDTAYDSVGGNDGTRNGAGWTTGKIGSALGFDGTDDYVQATDDDSLSFGNGSSDTAFTMAAWVKIDDNNKFQVLSKGDWFNSDKEYGIQTHTDGKLFINLADNSQSDAYIGRISSSALSEGVWQHIAATYNGNGVSSGLKLYVNGVRVDNGDVNSGTYISMENQSTPLWIGQRNNADYADGVIDEVVIWGRELSGTEIQQLCDAGSSSVLKGTIKGAYATFVDGDTVKIASGYGDCRGSFWDISTPFDHDMTSVTANEDFHYIYVDYSASDFPDPTVIDSTAEPTWSDLYQGWYNGDDRCIAVVWSMQGSNSVANFGYLGDDRYVLTTACYMKTIFNEQVYAGDLLEIEATAYSPVNALGSWFAAWMCNSTNTRACVSVTPLETRLLSRYNAITTAADSYDTGYAEVQDWIEFQRGWSRDLLVGYTCSGASGSSVLVVNVGGYRIER